APLPGTVMQIYVNVGDVVKRGDKLMMYEAMKMENNFLAEVDGTIKEIKVRVGDNILQGAVLFVIG
ncbi:MAG: biotin/lipoyl-binding protein, partial [Bacteroidales bacterium]|nr:biotin/lipoyl-binding protein [Bacteroidales bacterium]